MDPRTNSGDSPRGNTGNDRFDELRALLLAPEREELSALRHRLENPSRRAEDVAMVLADAVKLKSDLKLRRALQPLLEESLQLSVQANPRMLADALFPIFGKAIRKAITSELDGMLQSLSQTLEQSFSWRSLQWRWEAISTRKSYAEIVLLRSVLYRVEQVFLIHRKTGILLQHVAANADGTKDPEMISGMLTAIQDFVRDSVGGVDGDDLETVRIGEVGVVLAYGPEAILCGFVRGVPPRDLHRVFQDALDGIAQKQGDALRKFSGDTAPFDASRPQLEACLLGQGEPEERKATSRMARVLLFGVPSLLILGLLGWWIYSLVLDRRVAEFAQNLEAQPGIVLTMSEKRGGTYFISGLKDPLAGDPAQLFQKSGLPAGRVKFHWQEYFSREPRFVAERRFAELKEQVEKRAFRFRTASAEIPTEQRFLLEDVATQLIALLQAGDALGKQFRIEIRGNHDPVGAEDVNSTLARARAGNVQAALATMGVSQARMVAAPEERETCSAVKEEERLLCRSASFRVLEDPR